MKIINVRRKSECLFEKLLGYLLVMLISMTAKCHWCSKIRMFEEKCKYVRLVLLKNVKIVVSDVEKHEY